MAAGALLWDEDGRFLIVKPTYKPTWEIPGGVVEAGESPREACEREILEELGLIRPLRRLLCVDYVRESATKVEGVMFIFDGGMLSAADLANMHLPPTELSHYLLVDGKTAVHYLNERLTQRVRHALHAAANNHVCYLEDQQPVFTGRHDD
ncbi:MAG: NUDIX hydrolase [Chloroflexi bacterium]|nr:MAG: NUDIX hydrolase [Chloroflexota bacterium]